MSENKLKYFRMIDKNAGDLLCSMMAAHKHITNSLTGLFIPNQDGRKKPKPEGIRNILLIKFWGFGSILLMTPAVKALRKEFPRSRITILTIEQNKELCERLGIFDEVTTISVKGVSRAVSGILKRIILSRRDKYDLVIDFEFFVGTSTLITYLSGSPRAIGFGSERIHSRIALYTDTVTFDKRRHITKNFANLLSPLGVDIQDNGLKKLRITVKEQAEVSGLLRKAAVKKGDNIICININASELALERRWPKESFIALSRLLAERYDGAKLLLIGSKQEREYVGSAMSAIQRSLNPAYQKNNIVNLAGKLTLPQLQELLERSCLFITNDSGPMHLAAVAETKTICLFGPESPRLYAPLNRNARIIYKQLKCSPCMDIYNRKRIVCHNNARCMRKISVNDVIDCVEKELKDHRISRMVPK